MNEHSANETSPPWKWIAVASLLIAAISLIALLLTILSGYLGPAHVTDERLLGTWQSDVGNASVWFGVRAELKSIIPHS